MREVFDNLFIGNEMDYETEVRGDDSWAIVQACKEPYHRQALGYSGRGAPKGHPEYLVARRGNRLILNLVDVDDPAYIAKEIIDTAIAFIDEFLPQGKKVLVHCNQGASRSAGIALLYLAKHGYIENDTLASAEQVFKQIYPACSMTGGIRGFLQQNWDSYTRRT